MESYIEKYEKIVNQLIKRSFPELKNEKMILVEIPRFIPVWSFAQKLNNRYYIIINKSRRVGNKTSLKGQLAHELCHIIYDHSKNSNIRDLFYNIRKLSSALFNTAFSRKIEKKIDKETIKRNYGKELISRNKEWEVSFPKIIVESIYKRGYMRTNEIKRFKINSKK